MISVIVPTESLSESQSVTCQTTVQPPSGVHSVMPLISGWWAWAPEAKALMDQRYSETHYSAKLGDYRSHLKHSPSEYFHRNIFLGASCMPRREVEMRAAIGLAGLQIRGGRAADARRLLAPLVGWFSEGFDTHDVRTAHAMLEQLGPNPPPP